MKEPLGILIAVGNQKGGTGKTTNTVHLAAALGMRGYRCLIIDLVPDAGSTIHLGLPPNTFSGSLELLTTNETVETLVATDKMPEGVHLIPSRRELSELSLLISKFVHPVDLLLRPIAQARRLYDFIFLDTPPDAGAITTISAYSIAEWFLLSAFPHPLSMSGLTDAFNDIADVRQLRNPNLEVLGVIFTNVDMRTVTLRAELQEQVKKALPGREFQTIIAQTVLLPTLSGEGKTIFQKKNFRKYEVAQQYLRLSVEIEQRALNREAFLKGQLKEPDFSVLDSFQPNVVDRKKRSVELLVANG